VGKSRLRKLHGWRIFLPVKILTPHGGVLIAGKKPFTNSHLKRHDPWPTHGGWQGWRYFQGASQTWYWGAYCFLNDGIGYWYPGYAGVNESDTWLELDDDAHTPMPPDYRFHLGEAYNFIIRPKTFDKVSDDKIAAWILVH